MIAPRPQPQSNLGPAQSLHRALDWGAALVAALLVAVLAGRQDRLLADDAYITFRYAQNLAAGHGLVYNAGETVLGTSTPLFALLLALSARLGLDLPAPAVWIGALSWLGVVLFLAWSGRDRPALTAAPLLVLAASVTFFENLGMESGLYALLCLAALRLAGSGRGPAAAVLAGLASVTRLDGGLVAAVILLWLAFRTRRLPGRETGLVLLFVLPWYAYAWWTYGSPLPQSLQAKAGLAHSIGFGGGDFLQGGLDLLRARLSTWPLLMAYLGATSLGALWVRTASAWIPYLAWGALYVAAYWATGMPQFGWYYVPLLPWVAVLAQAGLTHLWSTTRRSRMAIAGILSAAMLIAAAQMAIHSFSTAGASPARAAAYREAGEWLAANSRPDDSVALLEIGVVGYYSGSRVVDTMGLVSPYLGERLIDWGQSLVLALQHDWPEYALVVETTAWEAVERQEWFALAYQKMAEFDQSLAGDPAARMRLYRRAEPYPPAPHAAMTTGAQDGRPVGLQSAGLHGLPLLTPGAPLQLELIWACHDEINADLPVTVALVDDAGSKRVLAKEPSPLRGGLPTTLWRQGEAIREVLSLILPADLPSSRASLAVSLGDEEMASLRVVVAPSPAEAQPHLEEEETVDFGKALTVLGWTVHTIEPREGDILDVSVVWQAEAGPAENWSIFVHLADEQERPLAQFDGYPFGGWLPTSQWQTGRVYADTYSLSLPDDLPPGTYRLLLGVYDWQSGHRLTPASERELPSGAVVLDTVTVTEGRDSSR